MGNRDKLGEGKLEMKVELFFIAACECFPKMQK